MSPTPDAVTHYTEQMQQLIHQAELHGHCRCTPGVGEIPENPREYIRCDRCDLIMLASSASELLLQLIPASEVTA